MDGSAQILFHSFLRAAIVSSYDMSRDVHSLILSVQLFFAFFLPTAALPNLQGVLENGFGEAVVTGCHVKDEKKRQVNKKV